MKHRAEWMANGSYGIMVHYFPTPSGKTAEELTANFNRWIDLFEVDYFLKQFEAMKADWLIFTMGQNTGYFNSPNAWLDERAPGFTPKRDLMLELAKGVKKLDKRFIVYMSAQAPQALLEFSPNAPFTIPEVQKAFAWDAENTGPFLDHYLEFVKEYSLKFGKLADGWWYDGCYESVHKNQWDWSRWTSASRAGNPDGAVAFNDGSFCIGIEKPVSPLQDYLSGEVHLLKDGKIRFDFLAGWDTYLREDGNFMMPTATEEPKFYMPTSQYVDGVQWQALVPVDSSFNPVIPTKHCEYSPKR